LHGDNPTRTDYVLTYGVAVIGAIFAVALGGRSWTLIQQIVVFVIAVDVLGGVVANVTRSTSTWYHTRPRWIGIVFILLHIVQPVVLILAVDQGNWLYAFGLYVYMVISAFIVEALPGKDVQLPTAYGLVTLGILLFSQLITTIPLLSWFAPAYLIKLVAAHTIDHYDVKEANKSLQTH
jgi:phage-related holin